MQTIDTTRPVVRFTTLLAGIITGAIVGTLGAFLFIEILFG